MNQVYDLAHYRVSLDAVKSAMGEDDAKKIAKQFFDENGEPINKDVWEHNYKALAKGINKGYGIAYDEKDVKMLYELQNNVAVFASFKAYRMGKDVGKLLMDDKGNKKSWHQFLKDYRKTDNQYNHQWLSAEYDMATKQAHAAADWQTFERSKDVYPNLVYMPSMAAEPRDAHKAYYGVVKPIDDPFWNTAYPPSLWGCQCYVEQTMDEATDKEVPTTKPPKGIVGNPGKTGMIFNPEHPYISKLTKEERSIKVKEAFDQLKPALDNDVVQFHGKKGKVQVSLNADKNDYLDNFSYAKTVMDKFDGVMEVRPHSYVNSVKNPELNYNGTVGDRTAIDVNKNDCAKYIANSFKDKYGKDSQLRSLKNSFIALDFSNKLTANQVFNVTKRLNGEFKQKSLCQFVIIRNENNVVIIERTETFEGIYNKIKKELFE